MTRSRLTGLLFLFALLFMLFTTAPPAMAQDNSHDDIIALTDARGAAPAPDGPATFDLGVQSIDITPKAIQLDANTVMIGGVVWYTSGPVPLQPDDDPGCPDEMGPAIMVDGTWFYSLEHNTLRGADPDVSPAESNTKLVPDDDARAAHRNDGATPSGRLASRT